MIRKVKLIHNGYLSARNGANTVMRSLLESKEEFAQFGIDISSLTPDSFKSRSFEPGSDDAGLNARRARVKKCLKSLAQYSRIAADIIIYLSEIRPSKAIVLQYINSNPDRDEMVFFHSLIPCYYYLKLRKTFQKTVLVCHTNGDNFKMDRTYYPALEKSIMYKKMLMMERYVIQHVDRINFVAELAKNHFLELHPEANQCKVSFVYNGIPDKVPSGKTEREADIIEMCCVASVSFRKGQHFIIEALKSIPVDQLPKTHITFVGDGPERKRLQEDVLEAGLSGYVTFVGVSYDVDSYLYNSDVYILPSIDEGLPMAIIEAMRASLPIISTPVGGIPEMINHGVNGLLIQPTKEAVRDLLMHLHDFEWKEMGANARKTFITKFSIKQMVEGYAKLMSF